MSMGATADAIRQALVKLEEAEAILFEGAYEGEVIDKLSDVQKRLRERLERIERSMRSEWQHGPAFTSGD